MDLMYDLIYKEQINIILDLEKDIKINGYENDLIQCFINIFNNARVALSEKNIERKLIIISSSLIEDKVIIKIKDNAQGIPLELLDKLFEPYVTTKHQAQGTGLSLYLTYNLIVSEMQGNIEVSNTTFIYENEKYQGAEFTISLPALK